MNVEEMLTRHDEQIKTIFNMLGKQEEMCENISKLATAIELQSQALGNSEKKLDTLSADVSEIKNKPAKRWETVVVGFLSAIVAGIAAYVLGGLK